MATHALVPTGEQRPELQLRELRDFTKRHGFVVHREYLDQASGDVRHLKRAPEFDALMADARRRRFDCVLVWKYDRLARSLGALIVALQKFRDLGVDFISHTQAIDTTTPMGWLFFHVIGSFAEFERVVALKGEGLNLRYIAARKRLSPSGVRKMLKQAGVETASAQSPRKSVAALSRWP